MALEGGCLCGSVSYTVAVDDMPPCYACHCTDCQSQSGSAFGLQIPLQSEILSVTGELREGVRQMPSGSEGSVFACAKCAVRIFATNSARPGMSILRAGTLDRSAEIIPDFHLWVKSMQPWMSIPENTPSLETQPDTPEEWMRLFSGSYKAT